MLLIASGGFVYILSKLVAHLPRKLREVIYEPLF